MESSKALLAELDAGMETETDRRVIQDLGILSKVMEDGLYSSQLDRDTMLPYYNISRTIFGGVRGLIDEQIPRERYPAAVVRMQKYAGLVDGHSPLVELAKEGAFLAPLHQVLAIS